MEYLLDEEQGIRMAILKSIYPQQPKTAVVARITVPDTTESKGLSAEDVREWIRLNAVSEPDRARADFRYKLRHGRPRAWAYPIVWLARHLTVFNKGWRGAL